MRIIQAFQRIIFPIIQINWLKFFRLYDRNSEIVIISSLLNNKKFSSELFIWELGYIKKLIQLEKKFSYKTLNNQFHNKLIFWSPSIAFSKNKRKDYPYELKEIALSQESKNSIYNSSAEIEWLENKFFMHKKFEKLKINTPKTWLYEKNTKVNYNELEYPLLYKGNHSSASQDIFKFNNEDTLRGFLNNLLEDDKIILQKLVNMRRDARITIAGGKIYSSFWRINPKKEWSVTASSKGSLIRFFKTDEGLEKTVLDVAKKCDLHTCGIDLCFENDDLNSTPIILEISPRFSLNPNFDVSSKSYEFKEYKKKVFMRNSYRYLQTKEIMKVAGIFVEYNLSKSNEGF